RAKAQRVRVRVTERKPSGAAKLQMANRRVGFCLSDEKKKRMNLSTFAEFCSQPMESQGPFDVIVHKLSDVIVEAEHDSQSRTLLSNFQEYVSAHSHMVLLDPLPAMTQLLDRFASYRIMNKLQKSLRDWGICSPPYLEINTGDPSAIREAVERKQLSYPLS
ncbi:hypothetical protein JZ751_025867, partial [Albula glossodonta]